MKREKTDCFSRKDRTAKDNIRVTLRELAQLVDGKVEGDGDTIIHGVADIENATAGHITFIAGIKYVKQLAHTRASAIIASYDLQRPGKQNVLYVKNPYLAFAKILGFFHQPQVVWRGISPRSYIHATAAIGSSVSIYPNVFIDDGVTVGDRVVLYPGVNLGRGVTVGDDTVLYPNVSVREGCLIGRRVIIHCNSVIGSDGFGFAKDGVKYCKIPQTGIVKIEDDVEIGACVTIDRATLDATVIGRGTKIDNLVQIAHNVTIGEDSIIVAQAGIAGSTRIGNRVTLAGQVGVVGHIEITDDVIIGSQSGVPKDIQDKGVFTGTPAIPHREWLKAVNIFAKLPEIRKMMIELEKRVEKIESESQGAKESKK